MDVIITIVIIVAAFIGFGKLMKSLNLTLRAIKRVKSLVNDAQALAYKAGEIDVKSQSDNTFDSGAKVAISSYASSARNAVKRAEQSLSGADIWMNLRLGGAGEPGYAMQDCVKAEREVNEALKHAKAAFEKYNEVQASRGGQKISLTLDSQEKDEILSKVRAEKAKEHSEWLARGQAVYRKDKDQKFAERIASGKYGFDRD